MSLAIDSAGGDDNFRTYNSPATPEANYDTSPTYSAFVPASTLSQTGDANNLSFSFDGNDDVYQNDINSPISTTFDDGDQFTIEAFVYPTVTGQFDTFIGRDDYGDKGGNGPEALFYLQQRADTGQFAVIAVPEAGGTRAQIDSLAPVVADQWYHLAAVGDGTNLMFYINGELQGSAPLAGGLFSPSDANGTDWTIGRGFYDDAVGDWIEGNIDEVRFSDTALDPSQFLNAPIPEPTTLALLPAVGLLAMRRRR